MTVYVCEFIESSLEALCMFLLALSIDRNNHLRHPLATVLLAAGAALVALVFSYFQLPLSSLFFFLTFTGLLFLLSENSPLRTLLSASLAMLAFFLMELIALTVFRTLFGSGFAEDHRLVLLLLGTLLVACLGIWYYVPALPSLVQRLDRRIPLALLICGDILLFTSIITNLWNRDSAAFFADFGSILLQITLFCLITCTLGYLSLGFAAQRSRTKVMAEYNTLLEQTMEDMRQREHEYKNELNVIISIAEHPEHYSLDMIKSYAQQLYAESKEQPVITLVKDNTVMSFLLLRYRQMADRQETPFSTKLCDPFPSYRVSEKDLLEMVSNLLNNAFEATAELPASQRSVLITFGEDAIVVENTFPAENGDLSSLSRLAERGNSTKGAGRGYGLSNVIRIAEKYRLKTRMYAEGDRFSFWVDFGRKE